MFGQEGVQLCDFISCDLVSFSGEMPEKQKSGLQPEVKAGRIYLPFSH